MFLPSVNNHCQLESGEPFSDALLEAAASNEAGAINSKGLTMGDFVSGLGSPSYISTLDPDVSLFEQRDDSREIFLPSQLYEEHAKADYFQPAPHSPFQSRPKILHLDSTDEQYPFNHHTHHILPSLPQLITENLDSAVDTSMLMASNIGYATDPISASTTSPRGESYHDAEPSPDSSKDSQNDHPPRAPRKGRREKPRIQLAPDQPPTTQGKPRSRVYVACVQCRTRKIRCDGAKPICHNCGRRSTGAGSTCSYDSAPKRRGPDKTPGARQRAARDGSQEPDADVATVRRRRRKRETSSPTQSDVLRKNATDAVEVLSSTDVRSPQSPVPVPPISRLSDRFTETWSNIVPIRGFTAQSRTRSIVDSSEQFFSPCQDYEQPAFIFTGLARDYADCDYDDEEEHKLFNIVPEPSLDFPRKTWWDSLLSTYSSSSALDPLALTNTQREYAALQVASDLRFLFRISNYWLSFFHVPRFFGTFFDPLLRDRMQPSLILAACSLSIFWQSSEMGKGKRGRDLALRLRDQAEGALQGSLNAGWIDETLAQAACILAVFEVCAHPLHSAQRSFSSMTMLDQIIRTLSLTSIDADEPNVLVFRRSEVPRIRSQQRPAQRTLWHVPSQSTSQPHAPPATTPESLRSHEYHHESSPEPIIITDSCDCSAMSLGQQWGSASEYTPSWLTTPAWDENWSEGEIRKESCRRLCWSAVSLAAGHSSYRTANEANALDLFITEPANYRLLFPGEALTPSRDCKDYIWALNYRTMLLWHVCVRMRRDGHATAAEKARFGMAAWLEADTLEEALNKHKCGLERSFLFQGREYLFNTRMCISYEFQRYIPLAASNVGSFHRKKAEEWLTHQATVAKQVMHGLHTVTGGSGSLIQRPFFVFWFMSQISRALSLWKCDTSLSSALHVCQALLVPIDYLTALWPCPEQRYRYERLRRQLDEAYIFAGLPLPDPPNLILPSTSTSGTLLATPPSVTPLSWDRNYETARVYAHTTDVA